MVRAGFRMLVDSQDDLDVVGEAGDGGEAVQRLAATRADVVLMDVRMPRLDGVEATRLLAAACGRPPRDRADHLRPRRVRLRRDQGRRRRVPAEGRRPAGAAARHPGGARRRRRGRAEHHPATPRALRAHPPGPVDPDHRHPPRQPHRPRAGGALPRRPRPLQPGDRRRARRSRRPPSRHTSDGCSPRPARATGSSSSFWPTRPGSWADLLAPSQTTVVRQVRPTA